jgi:hypothetical protein
MIWRKITSILLIPALLWAGMGFLLSRHYCSDELISEHLYHSENSCGMEILFDKDSCHDSNNSKGEDQINKEDCCRNEWIQIDNIDTVNQESKSQSPKIISPQLYPQPNQLIFVGYSEVEEEASNSSPPEPNRYLSTPEFLATVQCYLI